MDRLVDKQSDHDDLLCRDEENEPEYLTGARREADFDTWLLDREAKELDYFLTH